MAAKSRATRRRPTTEAVTGTLHPIRRRCPPPPRYRRPRRNLRRSSSSSSRRRRSSSVWRASQGTPWSRSCRGCPTGHSAASNACPSRGLPSALPLTSAGGRGRPSLASSTSASARGRRRTSASSTSSAAQSIASSSAIYPGEARLWSTPLYLSCVRGTNTPWLNNAAAAFSSAIAGNRL